MQLSCFFIISSTVLSFCLAAPTACDPGAFCYNPDDFTKITVTRTGDYVTLKANSVVKSVTFTQNGKNLIVNCQNSDNCQAQLKADQFEKDAPITIKVSDSQVSPPFKLDSLVVPSSEGLTKQQRRQFSKAHAILMIIGWLFFVPSGFLFARLGRDLFKEQTLFGMAVWFQIHRAANFMGVVCICASMLCIFISQQWTWKGTGSGSKYWTEVHTDLGVISTVLAVAQPINSLFRCGPSHSQRYIFNWAHRCLGVIAYSLALTAIIIAAVHFKKIWNEPLLELVLVLLPIVVCLVASVIFTFIESDRFRGKTSFEGEDEDEDTNPLIRDNFDENSKPLRREPHILKAPVVFCAIGVFFCIAVALSLLVVNGYKN